MHVCLDKSVFSVWIEFKSSERMDMVVVVMDKDACMDRVCYDTEQCQKCNGEGQLQRYDWQPHVKMVISPL